jgi:hypothetical protein
VTPRSDPLIWLQLISLGALPLEALLVVLLLASADPGPLPTLERILAWALGAMVPAVLLWRRPADPGSLLLVKRLDPRPQDLELRLPALQGQLVPRLLFAAGVALLLPLYGWLDRSAALAAPLAPFPEAGRLTTVLLSCPLLALVVWQWQQLVQASWLLSRRAEQVAAATPLIPEALASSHLSPGLPLLDLPLLDLGQLQPAVEPTASAAAPPINPEQPSEDHDGSELDQQVD